MTEFSSRTLLCVAGLSPQVITETLYSLAIDENWIPDRVQIITTTEGARRVRLSLLSDNPGWLERLRRDYSLPEIILGLEDILVPKTRDGAELNDIRTQADTECMGDFILEQVRRLTADSCHQLHVSIAGGRKTMGFYLGYALSLLGRPQDRLSHVLVSEPYESCWDFFYPTPYSCVIPAKGSNLIDTRDATVTLAEIPIVHLRHGLNETLPEGNTSFSEAVSNARRAFAPPRLVIDRQSQKVEAAGHTFKLKPASLAMLCVFARRTLEFLGPVTAPVKGVPDEQWAEWFLTEYVQIRGPLANTDATCQSLRRGMDGEYFSTCKSRLHREITLSLGAAAAPYLISDGNERPRRYRLTLGPASIEFNLLENGASLQEQ